jgi:lysophospholipid acyltransferase (LPLAT)-like uncharacterized protein
MAMATWLGGGINRLLTSLCRVKVVGEMHHERRLRGEAGRCIYAAWHAYLWHGTFPLEGQGLCVMVSSHRDGEIIARMLARRGFALARGSSTRGGARALRDFARAAREQTSDLVVTIDGPRGPAREAKPGVLYSASLTGLPIVPIGVWAERAWYMKSWDRLIIGKPFSRVAISFGEELHIPKKVPREELESVYRPQLEAAMKAAEDRAREALAG